MKSLWLLEGGDVLVGRAVVDVARKQAIPCEGPYRLPERVCRILKRIDGRDLPDELLEQLEAAVDELFP